MADSGDTICRLVTLMRRDEMDGVLLGQTQSAKDSWNQKFAAAINNCNSARTAAFNEGSDAVNAAKRAAEAANSRVLDAMNADKAINERLKKITEALTAVGNLLATASE